MKVANLNIIFSLQEFKGNIVKTPFKIVYQTSSRKLEKKIKEEYPDLLQATEYSMEQLKRFQKMKLEIRKYLRKSTDDLKNIHNYFYQKHWVYPFKLDDKITILNLKGFNAKYWTDTEMPYLELEGELICDLNEIIHYYIKKKYLLSTIDRKFVKYIVTLTFRKPFPMILTYNNFNVVKDILKRNFEKETRKPKGFYTDLLKGITQTKDIHTYQKTVEFFGNDKIIIKINDYGKILKHTLLDNKGKVILGTLFLNDLLKKQRARKKISAYARVKGIK